jgi:hypothetical protein
VTKQVEIIPQVKLSSAEKIALIAASNNSGVLTETSFGIRENLRYLSLVEQVSQYDKDALKKRTEAAWKALQMAVRTRDASACEKQVNVIRSERWDSEKKVWKLTPAANEYLMRGRVIVTVGTRAEGTQQKRKIA